MSGGVFVQMEKEMMLWNRFEQSGHIDDYLMYAQCVHGNLTGMKSDAEKDKRNDFERTKHRRK